MSARGARIRRLGSILLFIMSLSGEGMDFFFFFSLFFRGRAGVRARGGGPELREKGSEKSENGEERERGEGLKSSLSYREEPFLRRASGAGKNGGRNETPRNRRSRLGKGAKGELNAAG